MAFTENYAILNDCPLFWEPELLAKGAYASRFHPELPLRIGVLPRRGAGSEIRWFEADPTYVLHWVNAYEEGDEIVLDGFFQQNPEPADTGDGGYYQRMFRFLALDRMGSRLHRWRLNLVTGGVREERLTDTITEFGVLDNSRAGLDYRYAYAATGVEGWFLFDGYVRHDVRTGAEERVSLPEGVYGSEPALAPRTGSTGADDGYLVTLITDMNEDRSECLIFDAARLSDGPVARVALPERISSGTHATWAAGGSIPGWRDADSPATALRL
jgi:carotenoid cleavage dioxygenase